MSVIEDSIMNGYYSVPQNERWVFIRLTKYISSAINNCQNSNAKRASLIKVQNALQSFPEQCLDSIQIECRDNELSCVISFNGERVSIERAASRLQYFSNHSHCFDYLTLLEDGERSLHLKNFIQLFSVFAEPDAEICVEEYT